MPLALLLFFRGGLQLLCLPHLRQEEKDVKCTFHLLHRVSLSLSLTAHQWRAPVGWVVCGQHTKQVLQYLYRVQCRGDWLLPLLRSTDRCAVCTTERQGRAAICCWKNPGSSLSPGTAKSCRWLLPATGSHHTGIAHRVIFHRENRNPNPALGRGRVCPEDLLFSCVNQEEEDGFCDLFNHAYLQQSKEGRRYGKPTVPPGGTSVEKSSPSSNVSHRQSIRSVFRPDLCSGFSISGAFCIIMEIKELVTSYILNSGYSGWKNPQSLTEKAAHLLKYHSESFKIIYLLLKTCLLLFSKWHFTSVQLNVLFFTRKDIQVFNTN